MFAVVLILHKPAITKYTALIYGLALIPASFLLDWLFQGIEKMFYVSLGLFARAALFTVGAFALVRDSHQVFMVAFIYLASWFMSSAVVLFFT